MDQNSICERTERTNIVRVPSRQIFIIQTLPSCCVVFFRFSTANQNMQKYTLGISSTDSRKVLSVYDDRENLKNKRIFGKAVKENWCMEWKSSNVTALKKSRKIYKTSCYQGKQSTVQYYNNTELQNQIFEMFIKDYSVSICKEIFLDIFNPKESELF